MQLPFAIIGVESKLFVTLAAELRPFSIAELSDKTGIHLNLLSRYILTDPFTSEIIAQNDDDTYQATNITRTLSNDHHANSLRWTQVAHTYFIHSSH
jgi:hypothetical protein